MQLAYGPALFPVDGVDCTTATEAIRNQGGVPYKLKTMLSGRGQFVGLGAQELSRLQLQTEAILATPGYNFVLFDDAGQATSIRLISATAEPPGVVVDQFSFPESRGGELVTGRTFTFQASATYPLRSNVNVIVRYRESVEISGNGGPLVNWQNSFNGAPVPVRLYPSTITTVIQSGEAVGYRTFPNPPLPVLPLAYLTNPDQSVRRGSPIPNGTEWPIAWRYIFRFPGRLPRVPLPNVFIG